LPQDHPTQGRTAQKALAGTEDERRRTEMQNGNGREVVIVEAVRTPIGRGHREKGYYKDTHPNQLLGTCFAEVIERAGIPANAVEDVITGCVQQIGEQGFNTGRNAWLQAGLPVETPATTVDRQCGSAQQAVNFGAALVAAGVHDVVIGGGVEHMGHIPMGVTFNFIDQVGTPWPDELMARYNLVPQGISAEMIADKWEIPRSELDELGLRSHKLAHQATEEGRFERETVPMKVKMNGSEETVVTDQGIRPDTSLEKLSQLKPAFKEDGKVTAGNSSQISDGASAVLLMTREKANEYGLEPRARIMDQTTVGVDPVIMLTGPIPATNRLLERNKMSIGDIDLIEINEAFASVVAAWRREIEPDMDRVNVNGGAIALGHPLGSTGARLITTLLHELERTDKEIGLVTMCCGGGLGTGTLIQRV
jgi:acetyl-CoA acyltransferase